MEIVVCGSGIICLFGMRIRKMGFIAGMISSAAVAGYAAGEAAVGLRV